MAEFPREVDLEAIEDTDNRLFEGATIDIRAMDRDRSERGWAGKIVGVDGLSRRLPMRVYPTVDLEHLASKERVRADATVEFHRNEDGEMVPRLIHLIRAYDDEA